MSNQENTSVLECKPCGVESTKLVSITEAAKINNVTRQAIYVAIKLNKLKARKETSRWSIHLDDLEDYRNQKYSRTRSTFNGQLLFDNGKGFFSVNQVAEMLKVPTQKIYYATRVGLLKAHRKGAAWVMHQEDVKEYCENYLNKKEAAASVAS
ncbi:MAG: helix-turn-helix domain-containing protein [Parachlamydiaceae bacterium]|nr:helix-turn-helix domain-containing protein [Parachlamydiaceae bacterium]